MKRLTAIACALVMFSGTASAQANPVQSGVLGALLGPEGVVMSLVGALQQASLQPTSDALAARHPVVDAPLLKYGENPLLHQAAARNLNLVLSALLTYNTGHYLDLQAALQGVAALLDASFNRAASLVEGRAGRSKLIPRFGATNSGIGFPGASILTATGQAFATEAIRLNDINPTTQATPRNGIALTPRTDLTADTQTAGLTDTGPRLQAAQLSDVALPGL